MKKGFTLIELLAVIVILAIIAVIAVPIVLNIIDNTKDNATLRSAEFYLNAVEMAVATEKLEGEPVDDGIYLIDEDGNLCRMGVDCLTNVDELIEIEMNGEKPTSGEIIIENGKVKSKNSDKTEETTLFLDDYIVKYDENNLLFISTEVLITSIALDYSECSISSSTADIIGCTPTVIIEPSNATNKSLKFSFEGTYPGCSGGDQDIKKYLQIDESTGILSGTDRFGSGYTKNATIQVTATATDGSEVSTTVTKSFTMPGWICGWY